MAPDGMGQRSFGPLVPRAVHAGAIPLFVGSAQFIAAMIAVQLGYPGYSDTNNYISDLGNPTTSPYAWIYNVSVGLTGLLAIVASILIRGSLPPRTSARLGRFFLALAGVGALLVGTFPENSPQLGGSIHSYVSGLAFVSSGFALLFLGLGMLRDTRWDGMRAYTALSGLVTFVALIVFLGSASPILGVGGWERLIVAPILLWAILAGVHLLRVPALAPRTESLIHP